MTTTEELRLVLKADAADATNKLRYFKREAEATSGSVKSMQSTFAKMRDVMQGPIAAFTMGKQAILAIANGVDRMIMSAKEGEMALSNLRSVLISTNGVSGMTLGALSDLSSEMARLTLFTDEQVSQSEAVLLTFKTIGKTVFPEATRAIADMAQVMGMDLQSATVMVGKALNEPIKGIGALRKVGVQLTETQAKQIENYIELNDVMSAQKIIIGELNSEFGGAAKNAAETAIGSYIQMKKAIEEVGEAFGTAFAVMGRSSFKGVSDFINEEVKVIEGGTKVLSAENIIKNIFKVGKIDISQIRAEIESAGGEIGDIIYSASRAIEGKQRDIKFLEFSGGDQAQIAKKKEALEGEIATYNSIINVLKDRERWEAKINKEKLAGAEAAEKDEKAKEDYAQFLLDNDKYLDDLYKQNKQLLKNAADEEAAIKAWLNDLADKEQAIIDLNNLEKAADQSLVDWKKNKDAEALEDKKKKEVAAAEEVARLKKEIYEKQVKDMEQSFDIVISGIRGLFDEIGDLQSNQEDAEIAALERKKKRMEENGEDTKKIDKQILAAKNQSAKREFEARKLNHIADIIMSTASAVMSSFALDPTGILAAVIAGLGIAQVAVAGAQQYVPMAKGGIVTQPTHALIGEAGPEAIIPLNKAGGLGGNKYYITNQYIQGSIWKTRELEQLAVGAVGKNQRGF